MDVVKGLSFLYTLTINLNSDNNNGKMVNKSFKNEMLSQIINRRSRMGKNKDTWTSSTSLK